MKRHPSKRELLSYAESLVDTGSTISAAIVSHVAECSSCLAEVNAMRASFEFCMEAAPLEPSTELTAGILLAARQARQEVRSRSFAQRVRPYIPMRAIRTAAYAAGALLVGAVGLMAATYTSNPPVQVTTVNLPVSETSPDVLRKTSAEIEMLAEAVGTPSKTPPSLTEREHRRSVSAVSADIEAARAALERNPGCARASRIMDKSLQRKAQALKAVYVERNF